MNPIEHFRQPARLALGTLLSAALAILVSMLFARSAWRGILPLAFAAILILLSRRFGVGVSVTGSLAALVVFSLTLFTPLGSPRVESDAARANLGWMVLGAVTISYLLYPASENRNSGKHRR